LRHIRDLYAFTYEPRSDFERKVKGWTFYDPYKEFARLGLSPHESNKAWRFSKINANFEVRLYGISPRLASDTATVLPYISPSSGSSVFDFG
jgi:hypothetical protein